MQRDDFEVRELPGLDALSRGDGWGRLRVALVTEEILGPVRNGGIASTYYHLVRGLAAHGHEVHVLLLKGPVVQDATPEHWVEHYAEFGVTLHYLEVPDAPVWAAAPEWQRRYAAAYHWLRDQERPFDLVHTSEWRGGLAYALMAKRLGLAFRDTLFVVKTSSPHIWNRHYQMQPVTQPDLLTVAHAEQACVELADVVVGGSAHLISFMERIGYRLPPANVLMQPNIVDFSTVAVTDQRPGPPRRPGDVVRSRDLVFFGRLEARKGLDVFCTAIDLLLERGVVPDSVTFLGKWGGRLPAQGDLTPEAYLEEKVAAWDFPVTTVTDRNQPGALSYLCERDVIAVMPSLIENSSVAIYELLEQRVPFVASNVGGSPELVAEEDHADCLLEPTAVAFADRLEEVLAKGQVVARPRFSTEENLRAWYEFHDAFGASVAAHGRAAAVERIAALVERPGAPVDSVGLAVLVRRGDDLGPLVEAVAADPPDHVALAFTDPAGRAAVEAVSDRLGDLPTDVRVLDCLGLTAGSALDRLVREQPDAVVLSDGGGVLPRPGLVAAVRQGLTTRPDSLVTTFLEAEDGTLAMPVGGDPASQARGARAYGPEVVALRRDTWTALGGFEPYDARRGLVHELVTRAAERGHDLLVVPEPLLTWRSRLDDLAGFRSDPVYAYLTAKALVDDASLARRKLTLSTLHATGRSGGVEERLLRPPGDEVEEPRWLVPSESAEPTGSLVHRRLLLGLDRARNTLWFYARGPGERRLEVRGEPVPLETAFEHGDPGSEFRVTLSLFAAPEGWDVGESFPMVFGLYDGEEKLRNFFLRVNKLGAATYALAMRHPVVPVEALTALADRVSRDVGVLPALLDDDPGEGPESASAQGPLDTGAPGEERAQPSPPAPDPVDLLVHRAVATARGMVGRRHHVDQDRAVQVSRDLLRQPPPTTPPLVMPRSGLHSPHGSDGWVAGSWLRGWAWDREDRERQVHVALFCGSGPLFLCRADGLDPSLDEVPGRDEHAFSIPVLAEFLAHDRLWLQLWEGGEPVFRGDLRADDGTPAGLDEAGARMLRRLPPATEPAPPRPRTRLASRLRALVPGAPARGRRR